MARIIVVGSSNTDLIIKVSKIPRPGETLLGGEFMTFPGGKGANQAVAAARAGGKVILVASVGDDAYGQEAIKGYQLDKINVDHIKICKDTPSGIAMITIADNGENAITVASGANAKLMPSDIDLAERVFEEADFMLVQLEIPLDSVMRAAQICANYSTKVILNPAPAADLPKDILEITDIITPNETEAEALTGVTVSSADDAAVAANKLHDLGVDTVIITMGAQGAFLSDRASGACSMVKGFTVNAVDTTAAGDVFNGQLAVALAEGSKLEDSIRIAHSAAALSVQKLGAQSSIPKREETNHFLVEKGVN